MMPRTGRVLIPTVVADTSAKPTGAVTRRLMCIGTITVLVFCGTSLQSLRAPRDNVVSDAAPTEVSEKALKGRAISHAAT
jgi:hypothetical protein